jgi:peptidoglycan L-alanyl-D-glutamate endopeptidase CwlK
MTFEFSRRSLRNLEGCHPNLVRVAKKAVTLSPIDFGISHGVRTLEQQQDLYAQGRSLPGPIVTWTMNSKHLKQADGYGHAIDILVFINGKVSWEERFYNQVAPYMKKAAEIEDVKIIWGGDWKNRKDRPHYEIVI